MCNGLGLFIACSDDVDSVTIPSNTPICGYSRGIFTDYNIVDSDKTVLYKFNNINQGVLFEKKVMRLKEVIHIMMDRYGISALNETTSSILLGHMIATTIIKDIDQKDDGDDDELNIIADERYKLNYFIPDHYINSNNDVQNNGDDNTTRDDDYNNGDNNYSYGDNNDEDNNNDDDNNDNDTNPILVKTFDINATNIGKYYYNHCLLQ